MSQFPTLETRADSGGIIKQQLALEADKLVLPMLKVIATRINREVMEAEANSV
jgi:hypothetical protein